MDEVVPQVLPLPLDLRGVEVLLGDGEEDGLLPRGQVLAVELAGVAVDEVQPVAVHPPSEVGEDVDVIVLAGDQLLRPLTGDVPEDPLRRPVLVGQGKAAADVDVVGPVLEDPRLPRHTLGGGSVPGDEEQDGRNQGHPGAPADKGREPAPAALGADPGGLPEPGILHPLQGGEEGRPVRGQGAGLLQALDQLLAEVAELVVDGHLVLAGGHGEGADAVPKEVPPQEEPPALRQQPPEEGRPHRRPLPAGQGGGLPAGQGPVQLLDQGVGPSPLRGPLPGQASGGPEQGGEKVPLPLPRLPHLAAGVLEAGLRLVGVPQEVLSQSPAGGAVGLRQGRQGGGLV